MTAILRTTIPTKLAITVLSTYHKFVLACRTMRMAVGGSVISIVVFALLLSLAQGQCDDSCVHSCSDKKDAYDYPNPPDSDSTSFMLYELLEQSLLNDRVNLYKMRRVFFPNDGPKPIVVTVAYNVIFHNITDELCAGAFNGNGSNLGEENSNSTAYFSATAIWTSSITFSILHPEVVDWLTPTLLYLLGPIRGSYFDHSSSAVNVHLTLNVPFLPCTPSPTQMMDALNDITTMLKAFAEAKGPVSSSDPKHKGFTVQGFSKFGVYWEFSILTIVLMIITFFVYREFIIIKWVNNLLMYTYKALWVNVATLLFIIVYVSFEIVGIGLWLRNENRAVATVLSKFVVFLFTCCILPLVLYCRTGKGLYYNKSWCFLILLTIVVWGLTPTVILTFVNPVQTLGIMLSVISLIVLYISSVSTLVHLGRKRHLILLGFSSCGLTLILFVEYLLHSGVDTDGIYGLVLSFAPGIVIAIANWTFRKYFVQYKKDSGKEVGNGDHSNNPGTDIKIEEHSIPILNDSGTDVENEEHSNDCGTDV